jgi:hypothetical protein
VAVAALLRTIATRWPRAPGGQPDAARRPTSGQGGDTCLAVCKIVSTFHDAPYRVNVYGNEKKWLRRLGGTGVVARPLAFDDERRCIVTAYAGKPVSAETLPGDWEAQRDRILSVLRARNCRHNDIKPGEILVLDGKLRLCDFGWASRLDRPCPSRWPVGLGSTFKAASGTGFDDEVSFNKSVYAVCARSVNSRRQPAAA